MEGPESKVSEGQHVLLLWSGKLPSGSIEDTVSKLKEKAGENGGVALENAERLKACKLTFISLIL